MLNTKPKLCIEAACSYKTHWLHCDLGRLTYIFRKICITTNSLFPLKNSLNIKPPVDFSTAPADHHFMLLTRNLHL